MAKKRLIKTAHLISVRFVVFSYCVFCATGCGYQFQSKANPWANQGIEKVYVKLLTNNTQKSGEEVNFTSAFVRAFSEGNKVRVVSSESQADAVVEGIIEIASSSISQAPTTVGQTTTDPTAAANLSNESIATEYRADGRVSVRLIRTRDRKVLWTHSFASSKLYPGNNRYGFPGVTSTLINESDKDTALQEVARNIASDAYDFIFEAF